MDLVELQRHYAEEELNALRAQVAAIQKRAGLPVTSEINMENPDKFQPSVQGREQIHMLKKRRAVNRRLQFPEKT